jgi:hypothetical protein
MEAYLVENSEVLALDEDELSDVAILDAELPLAAGRRSKQSDGRIDLLAGYGDATVGVIELKLGQLNDVHLKQLADYLETLDREPSQLAKYVETDEPKLIGVLVGSSISMELRSKIEQGLLVGSGIPIAALTLRRYQGSDNNVYVVTDTYFHNMSRNFDRTKYELDGELFGKGRLVLATIRMYVNQHPGTTFASLEAAFPKNLKGKRGCFATQAEAQRIAEADRKRHFLEPDELIELVDARIAVSNQWGIRSIPKFLEVARGLGFKITPKEPSPQG